MRLPSGLRKLDDKVLGERGARGEGRTADQPDDRATEPTTEPTTERTTATTRTRSDDDGARRGGGSNGGNNGDGLNKALAVVWRVSRLVLIALALVVLTAAALVLLPANEDNVIVRNVLSLAETVAGPFRDVFTVEDPDRMRVVNYGLASVVYFVLAAVVGKLPTGGKRS